MGRDSKNNRFCSLEKLKYTFMKCNFSGWRRVDGHEDDVRKPEGHRRVPQADGRARQAE